MANNQIINELQAELDKGKSLKQAMFELKKSLIEKNYTEEEIEQAARVLQKQKQIARALQMEKHKVKPRLPESQIITILEGLKGALARRESLRRAMFSFYNAGYKKEEIEEAARSLQREEQIQPIQQKQPLKQKIPQPKTIQRVSDYPSYPIKEPMSKRKIFLISLTTLLVILLGALVTLFLFKEQVLDFFDNSKFFSSIFG